MNRAIKRFSVLVISAIMLISCQEEEPGLGPLLAPSNLVVTALVNDDQSGNLTVIPSAENALNFQVFFNPGENPVTVSAGESATFRYTVSGQYQAPVTVVAFGAGGLSSSTSLILDLDVRLLIAPETLQQIAGNGSKRWVWNKTEAGHFGVGPLTNDFPEFFSATPNSLNACLYDDILVFSHDGNNNYSYELLPGADNLSFINWTDVTRFFADANPQQFVDECRDITNQVPFQTAFNILDNEDGSRTLDVGASFLSYFAVVPGQYEIIELTADKLVVRGTSQPFNGDDPLYWYSTFIPEDGASIPDEVIDENIDLDFDTLVWSDEFNVDGAPDTSNWNYDLGDGGWGNNELQTYTNNAENVFVEDGVLKITARANGNGYTSARMKSENLVEVRYGRVEIRAKLPAAQGTWPALWMLGANFDSVGWPNCGEMDIMEQTGWDKSKTSAAVHYPNFFAGNAPTNSTENTGSTTGFHDYILEWTPTEIKMSVDNDVFFATQNNSAKPFNSNFFFIMNVAMGGTLGGEVDPAFTSSAMEVDYIRLYQ